MKSYKQSEPCIVVIFGAAGDLTSRKLIPAMFNLFLDKLLGDKFSIIGIDRVEMNDDAFRSHLRKKNDELSRRGKADTDSWNDFASRVSFVTGDVKNPEIFKNLVSFLNDNDKKWGTVSDKIFYLAVPPSMIKPITTGIGEAHLVDDREHNRIVVEKPFGHDLDSAKELNNFLKNIFSEPQIYRIDHYLGKETVQNILAFRFANSLFEPIWNRRYIDHVQITVAEDIGIEHRGGYYENAGALRDMVQNHLLQLLCLIAMEAPVSYKADEIRNKKVDVLRAIRPIPADQAYLYAVRGQYNTGWIKGERVRAYRQEDDVRRDSNTETFAAVKFFVDNWRWQDVPFYIRTGKRLHARVSDVIINFKPVPHQSFPSAMMMQPEPNRIVIRIQPDESILMRFHAKHPGETMRLNPVYMKFSYEEAFKVATPEAYETLLHDIMLADFTQFMRGDQLEIAWEIITPILDFWQSVPPTDFPNYDAGSWGPDSSEILIAQDGRAWALSSSHQEENKFMVEW